MFVRVSHNQAYPWQCRQFLGSSLRIATGNKNPGCRALSMNATNRRTYVLIGRGCHRARIQHDHFGFPGRAGTRQSPVEQLALNRSAVRLRRAASEIFYEIRRHTSIIGVVSCQLASAGSTSSVAMLAKFRTADSHSRAQFWSDPIRRCPHDRTIAPPPPYPQMGNQQSTKCGLRRPQA